MGSTVTPEIALSAPSDRRAVVLDTNVVLDWLVFRNPVMDALTTAIVQQQVSWIACQAMRDELSHMLGHASLAHWRPDTLAALAVFDRHALLMPVAPLGAAQRLVCTDADDQIFIDLAIAHGARDLVTHDRALLKLARRAQRLGVRVLRPAHWPGPG